MTELRSRNRARFGWVALVALATAYACGSPTRDYGAGAGGGAGKAGATGSGGGGGASAGGKTSAGGKSSKGGAAGEPQGGAPEGGTAGNAGQGGEGGEIIVPPEPGRPGNAVVAGGYYMKSKNYSLMSTVGEAPGGNGVYSSTKYVLLGGVVGTTQP